MHLGEAGNTVWLRLQNCSVKVVAMVVVYSGRGWGVGHTVWLRLQRYSVKLLAMVLVYFGRGSWEHSLVNGYGCFSFCLLICSLSDSLKTELKF